MRHNSYTRNSIIWCFVDGGAKRCLEHRSRISHKSSTGLRSGDWDGHGIWFTSFSCSSTHSVTTWCPVDGGIVLLWGHRHGSQNNGLPSIFIHDPKHDGILIAYLIQELHLCGSTCFQYLLYPSFTQVLPLFCEFPVSAVSVLIRKLRRVLNWEAACQWYHKDMPRQNRTIWPPTHIH